jgi:hypothetical protein
MLTPARRRGHEILDDPSVDPALSERSLRDIALANRMFGGRRAILREVRRSLQAAAAEGRTLLDIGTGLGDIPHAAEQMVRDAHRRRHGAGTSGGILHTIGLEVSTALARVAHRKCRWAVTGMAQRSLRRSQHRYRHLFWCSITSMTGRRALLARVSPRHGTVVIGDLRRAGSPSADWLPSLGFIQSVGMTRRVDARYIAANCPLDRTRGWCATVVHSLGWRVTACWSPVPAWDSRDDLLRQRTATHEERT